MASTDARPGLPRAKLAILVSSLLVSGVCNSMLNKYQDMQVVDERTGKTYEQPVFQTLTMFVGETFCLVAFSVLRIEQRRRSRRKLAQSPSTSTGVRNRQYAYNKLPMSLKGGGHRDDLPVDSGVVLNSESSITMRTVLGTGEEEQEQGTARGGSVSRNGYETLYDADELEDEEQDEQEASALKAHKAVVGPDELVPAAEISEPNAPEPLEGSKQLLMWLPAIFDICGTTLMNVGLLWVPVSVYQMLRGALVLFVGLFSVIFLDRRLPLEQWLSLLVVMAGIAVVGLSNALTAAPSVPGGEEGIPSADAGKAVIGAALVLFAQIFTASQFVIEEKIMTRYALPPLKAVGLEGAFGLFTTSLGMPVLFFLFGRSISSGSGSGNGGYFDIPNGLHETFSNPTIWITSIAIACSIAFFNFAGLAVTKSISATARSLLDCCRTVGIWMCSLALGWETLAPLQVVGFALLVYGTLCFNEVVRFPFFRKQGGAAHSQGGYDYSAVHASGDERADDADARSINSAYADGNGQIVVVRHDPATPVRKGQQGDNTTNANERSPLLAAVGRRSE